MLDIYNILLYVMHTVIADKIVVQNATAHCTKIVRKVDNISLVEISIVFKIEIQIIAMVDE